jgi:hypothetical protein
MKSDEEGNMNAEESSEKKYPVTSIPFTKIRRTCKSSAQIHNRLSEIVDHGSSYVSTEVRSARVSQNKVSQCEISKEVISQGEAVLLRLVLDLDF